MIVVAGKGGFHPPSRLALTPRGYFSQGEWA